MGIWYFHAFQPSEVFCVSVPGDAIALPFRQNAGA